MRMRGNGIGYRKRFIYASFGKLVLIVGWGNYGEFKRAFRLKDDRDRLEEDQ